MKRIKKINPISLGKVLAVINGVLYLIVVLLIILLGSVFFDNPTLGRFDFLGFGSTVVATVLFALVVAGVNFIIGLILGWLYNLAIPLTGGLKIDLDERESYGGMFERKRKPKEVKEEIFKSESAPEIHTLAGDFKVKKEISQMIQNGYQKEEKRDTFSDNEQ